MKKLILLAVALLALTACGSKPEDTLTIATSPDYPPYEFIDPSKTGQDKYMGADIELAKYIADKLDKKLVIEAVDFTLIPTGVAAKKYDLGISGFTYEAERAEVIDFSKPYDTSESACQGFLVKKDKASKYTELKSMETSKLAVQNASAQLGYVNEQLPQAEQQLVNDLNQAVLLLKSDKVDAIAISCASGESVTLTNPDLVVAEAKFALHEDDGTMVIAPKGSSELLDEINTIIEEVKSQGLYKKWLEEAIQYAKDNGIE